MNIWIINPFDELPGDTDVRHRYWALADTLSAQGHSVTWWSSDFSHRSKAYRKDDRRPACPPSAGPTGLPFSIRLIHTPPYSRNISLARLRNHRAFARGFLDTALADIGAGRIPPPDRMVVSLPPLGTAQAAFAIRGRHGGRVILDIMDAWPETFYRVLGSRVPRRLCALLFYPWRRTAIQACRGADRISAVSQIYIDLAKARAPGKPTHLCYHGIDLHQDAADSGDRVVSRSSPASPLKIVYIGALERSYDLQTAIRAVHQLNQQGHQVELHIAGAGSREPFLINFAHGLESSLSSPTPLINFHGLLGRDALRALLQSCHIGLIPMRQDSCVGLPYKLADYCAAGLPVVSSLDGECRRLLDTKRAGSFYEPANVEALTGVIKNYLQDNKRLQEASSNSLDTARRLLDRENTYKGFAAFLASD